MLYKEIKVSAPGRICLFGEHQDYLQLPVIAMAIDLRVNITCTPRQDKNFVIQLPDIGSSQSLDFSAAGELDYVLDRDYFRSIYNVLYRKGVRFTRGYDCLVQGNIPINSGTASSSALNNAWCRFLLEIGENLPENWKTPQQVADFTHQAEVVEFSEPCGKMDQLSTAYGNITYIDFADNNCVEILPSDLGTFVLGDSLQPKDTMKILAQTKEPALSAAQKITAAGEPFSFTDARIEEINEYRQILTAQEYKIMTAMLINRDITRQAYKILTTKNPDRRMIGKLLSKHHYYLDKYLDISTPKINYMISTAIKAGAYGCKINGSGGGGCMFAYAPDNPQKVAEAIKNAGGKSYIIRQEEGIKQNRIAQIR